MNLFIDTNVLLSFFHYTSDDLEELKKLIVLVEQGKLVLHMPGQVIHEFRRNRENKIADALKRFNDQKLVPKFPQFCKDYPEYHEMRKAHKEYEKHFNGLHAKLTVDIEKKALKADLIRGERRPP